MNYNEFACKETLKDTLLNELGYMICKNSDSFRLAFDSLSHNRLEYRTYKDLHDDLKETSSTYFYKQFIKISSDYKISADFRSISDFIEKAEDLLKNDPMYFFKSFINTQRLYESALYDDEELLEMKSNIRSIYEELLKDPYDLLYYELLGDRFYACPQAFCESIKLLDDERGVQSVLGSFVDTLNINVKKSKCCP